MSRWLERSCVTRAPQVGVHVDGPPPAPWGAPCLKYLTGMPVRRLRVFHFGKGTGFIAVVTKPQCDEKITFSPGGRGNRLRERSGGSDLSDVCRWLSGRNGRRVTQNNGRGGSDVCEVWVYGHPTVSPASDRFFAMCHQNPPDHLSWSSSSYSHAIRKNASISLLLDSKFSHFVYINEK